MKDRARKLTLAVATALVATAIAAVPAPADFPYTYDPGQVPNDIGGEEWKYSASPDPANTVNNARPTELGGVRGGHVYDRDAGLPTAWQLTTGRPDVTIATIDSGIKWNEAGAMNDLAAKTRISKGEAPVPEGCASYDCNGDGVFNLTDYADDSRVQAVVSGDSRRAGPPGVPTPQDVLIAFSDGDDDDGNGYVDDMVGWDFLDDDNDPYDDVQYGHGTGEAEGSSSEVDNGGTTGTCPNCMVIHMRVGDSFIADVSRFAAAVTYATDNDVQIVQSALGTLNNSTIARQAVDYAYRHGTTMVVSAADEAAQHNNQPALPHTILVNSVTQSAVDEVNGGIADGAGELSEDFTPPSVPDNSYLAFNGCTNFSAKITVAIPSTSCSSDAVGLGSGMAGLIYSAALTAVEEGALKPHPDRELCETVDGEPCPITPNEVKQLMASGQISGIGADGRQTDDVNFLSPEGGPEPSCSPAPTPGCTAPFGSGGLIRALVNANRPSLVGGPFVSESYPARAGHDQFYGYGRVNMRNATEALLESPDPAPDSSLVPPEAEIRSPDWFEQVDPTAAKIAVEGDVYARGASYTCDVLVAPGQYPNQSEAPTGDFLSVGNGWCDGSTVHSGASADSARSGTLAEVDISTLKAQFPLEVQATMFQGPEPEAMPATGNGRPAQAPHSFTFKVVVSTAPGAPVAMSGEDQRAAYLHRDQDMLPGFPRTVSRPSEGAEAFPTGDGESSPAFADLDGDNDNELVYGSSDGFVHAIRPDGSELPGWPVRGDLPGFIGNHTGSNAYASGEVPLRPGGAMLAAVAVGDTDGNGLLEVYVADLEGKVYGWDHTGERIFTEESNPEFSGKPLEPFRNVRKGSTNRTQHGFIASPVLSDLDRDGDQELVAASMDRHVYAWDTEDSSPGAPGGAEAVEGFPMLVVDPAKVADGGVDPVTHRITFTGGSHQQGGIIDTPALADISGDERPEIIVGTNEAYDEPPNTSVFSNPSFAAAAGTGLIEPGNTRVYALKATGDRDGNVLPQDAFVDDGDDGTPDWPVPLAFLNANLLPVVGEGVTGYPVVAPASCDGGEPEAKIGVISYAGPGYLLNADGSSCYGNGPDGTYRTMATDQGASSDAADRPIIPAVGLPAFGDLGGPNPSFVVPAAGLVRALDLVFPEYQPTGQDYIAAYDTSTGQFRPNFPQTQNDLSFLTGPSIADIDGLPGEEVVSGSASMDLNAYTAAGTAVPGWPKPTTDWTVANPLIGSFGPIENQVVIGMTRSGYLNGYRTDAPVCAPASWPRFHHDNANSGDYSRDATLPGKPTAFDAAEGQATFEAPGDDLMCGTADSYELVTSAQPIDELSFSDAEPLELDLEPAEAGSEQGFDLPGEARRYLALRAVDEQGNVGRVATLDLGPGGGPGPTDPSDPADPTDPANPAVPGPGDGGGDGDGSGGGSAGAPLPGPAASPCSNRVEGSSSDDRLRGTPGPDHLRGFKGDDRIRARAGDDCVELGRGADRAFGGTGQDQIDARDGDRDRVDCGPDRDLVLVDPKDRVNGCERVREERR